MVRTAKKTALVTGAARRIGLRIAERLVEAGYDVALHASPGSREQADAAAARLAGKSAKTCVVTCDLADDRACGDLVGDAAAVLGPLTLLVNNAALFESDSAASYLPDVWERHFAVNLRAPVILAQCFAAQAAAGHDAAIVNLVDQRVLRPTPLYFSYTLSKSALWNATRTMAQAFAEQGVRVNALGPGPVLPNVMEGKTGFAKEAEGVLLHHAVDPDEIATTVLYLAEAKGVTGQLIAVDAGQHLAWRTPDVV